MLLLFQTSLFNVFDLQLLAPELILTFVACVALVIEVILPYKPGKWTAYFSLIGTAFAFVSLIALFYSIGGAQGPCYNEPSRTPLGALGIAPAHGLGPG